MVDFPIVFNNFLQRLAELVLDLAIAIGIELQLSSEVVDLLLFSFYLHFQDQHLFGEVLLQGFQLIVLKLYGLTGKEHFFLVGGGHLKRGLLCFGQASSFAFAATVLRPQFTGLYRQPVDFCLCLLKRQLKLRPLDIIELCLAQCLALYLHQLCINHLNIISLLLTVSVVGFSG